MKIATTSGSISTSTPSDGHVGTVLRWPKRAGTRSSAIEDLTRHTPEVNEEEMQYYVNARYVW